MELAKQNNGLALVGRLKEISDKEFKEFLLKEYHSLLLKNGQNPPAPQNAVMITNEIYQHLHINWPGIKVEWIKKAFQNGIDGEYGVFANISYRIMVRWIKEFSLTMKAEDFGVKEEPMNTTERAGFVIDGLRKRVGDINKLDKKGKEALKRKLNKSKETR